TDGTCRDSGGRSRIHSEVAVERSDVERGGPRARGREISAFRSACAYRRTRRPTVTVRDVGGNAGPHRAAGRGIATDRERRAERDDLPRAGSRRAHGEGTRYRGVPRAPRVEQDARGDRGGQARIRRLGVKAG